MISRSKAIHHERLIAIEDMVDEENSKHPTHSSV